LTYTPGRIKVIFWRLVRILAFAVMGDAPGAIQRSQPSPCNSALLYKSAVAHGKVRVAGAPGADEKKAWFFDRLLDPLKKPMSAYEQPGYARPHHSVRGTLEIVTGKLNIGLHHEAPRFSGSRTRQFL
jgi:hypothetical protein